jgi:hypothetical protein
LSKLNLTKRWIFIFQKNRFAVDTTWKVANIRIRPVTRMKQIDAISQPLEHGYKKLVFKRNSRMRLHQKFWVEVIYVF